LNQNQLDAKMKANLSQFINQRVITAGMKEKGVIKRRFQMKDHLKEVNKRAKVVKRGWRLKPM
jgi:hypothetical protein